MNKFDPTKLQNKFDNIQEGWAVQIYGGDRRLICVLESSHAWSFLLGCGFGLLLTVGWFNLTSDSLSTTYEPSATPSQMWID